MSTGTISEPVCRKDFLKKFVKYGGFTYEQAVKAYDSMVSVFSDAILNGKKINMGNVLSITPEIKEAREVCMPFKNIKNGREKLERRYFLGRRITYAVNIYKKFFNENNVLWFNHNMPE